MPEFRASSGLVGCQPFLRTTSGLVACGAQFFGTAGPVQAGGPAPLVAACSPDTVFGATDRQTTAVVTTNQTTVQVTGGVEPYAYAWGAKAGWTVVSPSAGATAFRASVAPNADKAETFTCTVTDARGHIATASVSASISNFGNPGGGVIP